MGVRTLFGVATAMTLLAGPTPAQTVPPSSTQIASEVVSQARQLQNAFRDRFARPAVPRVAPSGVAPPAIVSATILTPTLNVLNPKNRALIQFQASAPGRIKTAGFGLTSPSGEVYDVSADVFPPTHTGGTFVAAMTFAGSGPNYGDPDPSSEPGGYFGTAPGLARYLAAGVYTVTAAEIEDYAGQTTTYSAAQVAALLGGAQITVVNTRHADVTPPTIKAAKILTRTVSLGAKLPYVAFRLTVSDDYTGLTLAGVGASLNGNLAGPSNEQISGGAIVVPTTKGSVTAANLIDADTAKTQAVGTYVISIIYLQDAAGNLLEDSNSNDIATYFGGVTSFQITK